MRRADRLLEVLAILRGGDLHRARDIAARLGVSERTIYRDMDTLIASGIPIKGARGVGYRAADMISLPPLTLSPHELEALNLGIAILGETTDPDLKSAALSLAAKLDAALPEEGRAETDAWKFATYPFADATRGARHMATLRAAIRAHQKLHLTSRGPDGARRQSRVRPLRLAHWGRIWTLTAWCEDQGDFRQFRVDLIEEATALPELFVDEAGKTLADCPLT